MEKAKCTKCGEEKLISEFHKNKSKKIGRNTQCKTCCSAYKKEWSKTDHSKELKRKSYNKNRDKTLAKYAENMKDPEYRKKKAAQDKAWREANKEKKAASNAKWYSKNKERASKRAKQRYQNKKPEILANLKEKRKDPEYKKRKAISDKKWKDKNVEHLRKYFRDRARHLRKTDPNYVLVNQVRRNARRVNAAAAGNGKANPSSLAQLGCTIKEYRAHIKSLWEDWMNWDNYGPDPHTQWQIDHKIPLDWFVKNSEDIYKAGHYTNLQPMRGIDNQRKSNKILD